MPKKLTDRDRILAFAFRAPTAELLDAIAVLKAAHAAKTSGEAAPRRVTTRRTTAPKIQSGDGQTDG